MGCALAQAASLPTDAPGGLAGGLDGVYSYTLGNSVAVMVDKNGTSQSASIYNHTLDWVYEGDGSVNKEATHYLFTFQLAIPAEPAFSNNADKIVVSTRNQNEGLLVKIKADGSGVYVTNNTLTSTALATPGETATYTLAYVGGYAKLFSGAVTDATTLTAATDWVHVGDNGNYHLKNWNGSGVSRIHAGEGVTLTTGNVTEVGISVVAPPVTPTTPNIPEPTTATLSLLALAGLAARRRRK